MNKMPPAIAERCQRQDDALNRWVDSPQFKLRLKTRQIEDLRDYALGLHAELYASQAAHMAALQQIFLLETQIRQREIADSL